MEIVACSHCFPISKSWAREKNMRKVVIQKVFFSHFVFAHERYESNFTLPGAGPGLRRMVHDIGEGVPTLVSQGCLKKYLDTVNRCQ